MKVSIVTVSFNQGRFLERAIRSVVEQDHDDIEYIVVDPGSTDGSRDIIERYRGRIARVVLEPDRGAPDALNKGFAVATGELFAYLNADDAYLPEAVGAAVSAFERHPDADIIVGHGYIVNGHGRILRRFRSAPFSPLRFAYGAAVVMQQSTFFRASAFASAGGFNARNRASWDAELYLDMCLAGARVRMVEGYWSLFTIHPDSITGSGRLDRESALQQRRHFRRVMGREWRPSDRLLRAPARVWRWLADPRGLWERASECRARPGAALAGADAPDAPGASTGDQPWFPSEATRGHPVARARAASATRPRDRISSRRPARLCIVVQYPIHNHLPLHRALARDPDIALEVLFMQDAFAARGYEPDFAHEVDWGLALRRGYPSRTFSNASPRRDGDGFWKYVNPGLIARVARGPYDAVYVHGHHSFTHLVAILAARLAGKRVIIRTDTVNFHPRPLHIRLLKRLVYTATYRLAHALLYVGERNRRCFEDFGGRPEQLVHAPQVVDNARFERARARYAPRRESLKSAFGIAPRRKVVLFCAKFIAKKCPLLLIDAFLDASLGEEWVLLMVGDGPLRAVCEARAAERGAAARVVFAGFLDQRAVGRGYAVADILVLPSRERETWGLVVNEAMNFGCPIIVSDAVGCAPDLVAGKCGLVFPRDRPEALAGALRRMAGDAALRASFAERARAVIARWSVREYVSGVRAALGLRERNGP